MQEKQVHKQYEKQCVKYFLDVKFSSIFCMTVLDMALSLTLSLSLLSLTVDETENKNAIKITLGNGNKKLLPDIQSLKLYQ